MVTKRPKVQESEV